MKIESNQLLTTISRFRNETVETDGASAQTAQKAAGQGGDRVELSRRKEEVERLKGLLAQSSDNRAARIAELRQQISDGSYTVASTEVAAKMLERWRDVNVK